MWLFIKRMAWYALWLGLALILVIPLVFPVLMSLLVLVFTGHWNGWGSGDALYMLKGGLIATPLASFIFTLNEYARYRGWWK